MTRLLVVFATAILLAFALPLTATAAEGDYAIDELSTEVTVESNASTHIVERQIVSFDRRNIGYIWYLHVPENNESVRISNIRVAPVDDGGTLLGEWTRLQLVDSRPNLQGENPGDHAALAIRTATTQPWYSYSIGDGMVRCWFPTERSDGPIRYVIEADYTIAHRVRVYRDVAELYWRYANSSLPVTAYDVNLQVSLPAPEGALPIDPTTDVKAWGHGPDGGTLEIFENATITFHENEVERGNYAEAHVIFPAWWLGNVTPGSANVFTEARQAAAIAEEASWVDASKRGETWDFEVRALFLALAVLVILVGMILSRSRLALTRVAATLAIMAVGAQLFFREPLTTIMLATIAVIVAIVSLMTPAEDSPDPDEAASQQDVSEEGVPNEHLTDTNEEAFNNEISDEEAPDEE